MPNLDDIKYELARRDFLVFLDYVIIQGIGAMGEPGGPVPFIKWPHLVEVAHKLTLERLIAWLKARQIGASWLVAAYTLWLSMYHDNTPGVEFAEKENKAKELIRKQKYIYNHLPSPLKAPVKSLDNQLELEFDNGSKITAFPSTTDAAIGLTASWVWFDEFDFHEYGDEALDATSPLINDVGGQIILTSTSNPDTAIEGSAFKSIYANAKEKNYCPIFYGWDARPDRDEQWYLDRKAEARDLFQFEKHYPRTDVEALSPPSTVVAFRRETLDLMKNDNREPLEVLDNVINIYQNPILGKRYVAATDTSHGVGADDSVTVVVDTVTGAVVADIVSPYLPPEELAIHSVRLLRMYYSPLWGIEDNDWGQLTIETAQRLGYTNLYHQREDVPGWHTGAHNRFPAWGEYISAVHNRAVTIFSEYGLKQHYTVIRNPKKQGRIEAQEGQKDDYPTALVIASQMRNQPGAYASVTNDKPIAIRRFR